MENLLCSSDFGLKNEKFVLLLAIISDCLNWTASHRFVTQRFLLFCLRLLEDKRVVVFVGTHEILRRRVAADITIDTRRVYVICAGNIFFYAIASIRQVQTPKVYPQITQIAQFRSTSWLRLLQGRSGRAELGLSTSAILLTSICLFSQSV